MSMDGRFIHALAGELDRELAEGRINKIYQLSRADFLFVLRAGSRNRNLYVSLSPQNARVHLTAFDYDRPQTPTGFLMLLRKHLEGGQIRRIRQLNADRILAFTIANVNEYGVLADVELVIELMGRHANLILTEADGTIIDCQKRVSPFEERERTFLKGFRYELPDDGKIHPDDVAAVGTFFASHAAPTSRDVVAAIRGFSPLIADTLFARAFNRDVDLMDVYRTLLASPVMPTSATVEGKARYYWTDVFDSLEKRHFPTLSALLDDHFAELGRQERMNQAGRTVLQLVKRETERATAKLEKLRTELDDARDAARHRVAAELIIQNLPLLHKGDDVLKAVSYVDGSELTIVLDRLLEPMANAAAYFKKYKKGKQAVAHIEGQIAMTQKEIAYFDLLSTQLETATLPDLLEIVEELKANRYLHEKPVAAKRTAPAFETFTAPDGTEVVVGKNNLQNDYVTHRLARPNEWWFHVKDVPGSHVLLRSENPGESAIRAAALLAAYHSQARYSSSVPVDYTLARHVKKIPGTPGSFVTYTGQRTIYIDPDPLAVAALRGAKKR